MVRSSVLTCDVAKVLESRVMKDSTDGNGGEGRHCRSSEMLHLLRRCTACYAVGLQEGFVVGAIAVSVYFVRFVLQLRKVGST